MRAEPAPGQRCASWSKIVAPSQRARRVRWSMKTRATEVAAAELTELAQRSCKLGARSRTLADVLSVPGVLARLRQGQSRSVTSRDPLATRWRLCSTRRSRGSWIEQRRDGRPRSTLASGCTEPASTQLDAGHAAAAATRAPDDRRRATAPEVARSGCSKFLAEPGAAPWRTPTCCARWRCSPTGSTSPRSCSDIDGAHTAQARALLAGGGEIGPQARVLVAGDCCARSTRWAASLPDAEMARTVVDYEVHCRPRSASKRPTWNEAKPSTRASSGRALRAPRVPVRRRVVRALKQGPAGRLLGLGHDAPQASAAKSERRRLLSFSDARGVRRTASTEDAFLEWAEYSGKLLRHAARTARGGARGRSDLRARDRSRWHAAAARSGGRGSVRLHRAPEPRRAARAPRGSGAKHGGRHRTDAWRSRAGRWRRRRCTTTW